MAAHQAPPSLGFSRQEHWSGLPFPSPMHESEKWKSSCSVVSNSLRPHGVQPTRLLCPWDFPGKSTGVGCHCLLLSPIWISTKRIHNRENLARWRKWQTLWIYQFFYPVHPVLAQRVYPFSQSLSFDGTFSLFMFKIIIDSYVLTAILFIVLWVFYRLFFVPSFILFFMISWPSLVLCFDPFSLLCMYLLKLFGIWLLLDLRMAISLYSDYSKFLVS